MTPPGILPSPLRDKVGYSNHDRFRGHIPVHCCSGLQTPCLRFAMAVTGHRARLGTRLLAKLCRGRHSRRLGYMRFQGAPRTEPYVRLARIRLPPRVCDGEAIARPGVKDARFRKPVVRKLRHPCPRHPVLLTATPQRTPPEVDDVVPEHMQGTAVGRHCVVVEVAANDVMQPLSLFRDRLVHAPPHLRFDRLELRSHAVRPGLPFDLEFTRAGLPADEGEAQEVEALRFAEPSPLAALRRKASELDEPGLLGM